MDRIYYEVYSDIRAALFVIFDGKSDQFCLQKITCRIMNDPKFAENDKNIRTDFAINSSKDSIHLYK